MPLMQSPPGAFTVVDGRQYLYFAGTGYLGLQSHPDVIRAACDATDQYGLGSATSRTLTGFGDTPPALLVERRAAELFGCEAALYLSAGYLAPQALLGTVGPMFDVVLLDEYCHYALHDAARIVGKPIVFFRHRNPADLLGKLAIHAGGGRRPLVATDGVFSALGSLAPLPEYHSILSAYPGAAMLVDDAHGLGVLGRYGRGLLEHTGLFDERVNTHEDSRRMRSASTEPRVYLCASLSKAVGGYGGIIPGTREFVDWIRAQSAVYSGSTSPPPAVAAASAEGLRIVRSDPDLRARLHANTHALKAGLRNMGFDAGDTPAPIASLCLDSAGAMQQIQQELARCGILIAYFARYQGLPPQGALRIAVFATHTEAMIYRLLDKLGLCHSMIRAG